MRRVNCHGARAGARGKAHLLMEPWVTAKWWSSLGFSAFQELGVQPFQGFGFADVAPKALPLNGMSWGLWPSNASHELSELMRCQSA